MFKIIIILVVVWALWHWLTSRSKDNTSSVYSNPTPAGQVSSDDSGQYYYKVNVTFVNSLGQHQVYTNTYQSDIIFRESKIVKRATAEVEAMYDVKKIIDTNIQDVSKQVKRATR
ncbi:hypothetical protein [Lactiplantibacillus herbarum]|uniref:hypothetical protein n=1 Tax=Lactiplantibacillus herbarum TaxID=1670446 RepID=UPI00064E4074|nr:hypothetical protein [Lactiplantibacillus herbarum]